MPAKQRSHYSGPYQRQARLVRQTAAANPDTRCARCGQRLTDPPHRPGDTWDAGHQRDGDPTSPLAPEAASCNRSAGAQLGNRRRQGLNTTRNW